ncbi:MAG: hypothetical protein ABSA45_05675 [Verrucomicrobiota bacterium]
MKLKAPNPMDRALEYLKTFEFRRSIAWAVRLMNRYTAAEATANEALASAICLWANRKAGKVTE